MIMLYSRDNNRNVMIMFYSIDNNKNVMIMLYSIIYFNCMVNSLLYYWNQKMFYKN